MAILELIKAVEHATNETVAAEAVSEFAERAEFCPVPGEIRRAIWILNDRLPKSSNECPICEGSSWVTSYWLVTHEGRYKRKELLPFTDPSSLIDYKRAMSESPQSEFRQEVVQASKPCQCKSSRCTEDDERPRRNSKLGRVQVDDVGGVL